MNTPGDYLIQNAMMNTRTAASMAVDTWIHCPHCGSDFANVEYTPHGGVAVICLDCGTGRVIPTRASSSQEPSHDRGPDGIWASLRAWISGIMPTQPL